MAGTGQEVVGPDFLRDYDPDLVVAMNSIYLAEIRAELDRDRCRRRARRCLR